MTPRRETARAIPARLLAAQFLAMAGKSTH
jgi:hypothetical protein